MTKNQAPIWGYLFGYLAASGGRLGLDLGFILGAFKNHWGFQIEAKIGLEASGGAHGSPMGALGSPGCHFGVFWVYFGSIFEVKTKPISMPTALFFRAWILLVFCVFFGICTVCR